MTFIDINKPFGVNGGRVANDAKASNKSLYANKKTGGEASSSSTVYLTIAAQHLVSVANVNQKFFWDDLYYRESGTIPSDAAISLVRNPVKAKAHIHNNIGGMTLHSQVAGHMIGRA